MHFSKTGLALPPSSEVSVNVHQRKVHSTEPEPALARH